MADTLNLLYGFAPPANVYITEENAKPVANTLTFSIGNPSASALVQVNNPAKLGPNSNIPDYGSSDPQVNLSRFYIWFPYATNKADAKAEDIATLADAANIDVSPGTDNTSWDVVKKTNSSIGTYWTLFPKESSVLDPQQSVAFLISNLVSETPASNMSWMYIQAQDIPGYETTTHEVELFKELPKLAITSFALSDQVVYEQGSTKMTWSTVNADYVIATPALDPQDPVKRYTANNLDTGITFVPAPGTTEYTLTAYNERGEYVNSNPLNISVLPLKITKLTANQTTTVVNAVVMVSWNSENATSAKITLPPPYGEGISVNDQRLILVTESLDITLTVSNGYIEVSEKLSITAENEIPSGTYVISSPPAPPPANPGAPGSAGFPGRGWQFQGGHGANGSAGAAGVYGMPSGNVTYKLPVKASEGYAIFDLRGGPGQDGGVGGVGGAGGKGIDPGLDGPGGGGGIGGIGGNGGPGGDLSLGYDSETPMPNPIYVDLRPAAGGKGGKGGTGGSGNPHGPDGPNGKDGQPGTPGRVRIIKSD